jgi:hypothetical protein
VWQAQQALQLLCPPLLRQCARLLLLLLLPLLLHSKLRHMGWQGVAATALLLCCSLRGPEL